MSRAFDGARERGRRAFAAGAALDRNPYANPAGNRGRGHYGNWFWRAWREGWREAQAENRSPKQTLFGSFEARKRGRPRVLCDGWPAVQRLADGLGD